MANIYAAARMALELLDKQWKCSEVWSLEEAQDIAESLREALAAPEQPAAQWVGLTFDMIEECFGDGGETNEHGEVVVTAQWLHDFARAIEAKLKEKTMFKVHGYLDDKRVINKRMEHLPRVGDTIRFSDERYGKVTEVVWCMDEPSPEGQRVNIRIESEKNGGAA